MKQSAVLEVTMADVITMKHASMLNNQELVIDLSDGSTVELNAEQILSLHPHLIAKDQRHVETMGNQRSEQPGPACLPRE